MVHDLSTPVLYLNSCVVQYSFQRCAVNLEVILTTRNSITFIFADVSIRPFEIVTLLVPFSEVKSFNLDKKECKKS